MDILITLPILYETQEYRDAKRMGLDDTFDGKKNTQRNLTFYSIDAIGPNYEHDKNYTGIFVGGAEFICPMTDDEVAVLINDAIAVIDFENPDDLTV